MSDQAKVSAAYQRLKDAHASLLEDIGEAEMAGRDTLELIKALQGVVLARRELDAKPKERELLTCEPWDWKELTQLVERCTEKELAVPALSRSNKAGVRILGLRIAEALRQAQYCERAEWSDER